MENIMAETWKIGLPVIAICIAFAMGIAETRRIKKLTQQIKESGEELQRVKKENELMKSQVELWKERGNVIALLDWLRNSRFHNRGVNGWNQEGCSMYFGVESDYVLKEYEKERMKKKNAG